MAAWEAWLHYFLNGVARQSDDALGRAARMYRLVATWKAAMNERGSKFAVRLIDVLAANPYLTIQGATKQLRVAFTTVQRAVDHLEHLGIIKEVSGQQRNRVYCATALLSILEAPAQLSPNV